MANLVQRLRNLPRHIMARQFRRRMQLMRNRRPIISFSFDDFPRTAWTNGGAVLSGINAKATYYTCLGLMGPKAASVGPLFEWEDMKEIVSQGHELGCHTFDHSDAWVCSSAAYEESIDKNSACLSRLLPEGRFDTFAYPKGRATPATKNTMASHFACCRGTYPGFNCGYVDLNLLRSFPLYGRGRHLDRLDTVIRANNRLNGWLIFYTHDICELPSPFGCTLRCFEQVVRRSKDSGARVLPVYRAFQEAFGVSMKL